MFFKQSQNLNFCPGLRVFLTQKLLLFIFFIIKYNYEIEEKMNKVEIELPDFFLEQIDRTHARATELYGGLDNRALDLLKNNRTDSLQKNNTTNNGSGKKIKIK
jgi:hypothetical protein